MATATRSSSLHVAILSASDDSISTSLAFLNELSLWNVLHAKSADLAETIKRKLQDLPRGNGSSDHFQKRIMAISKELDRLPRAERLLQLIGALQQSVSVPPRDLKTRFDLEEVLEDLCAAAVRIVAAKEEKNAVSAFKQRNLQGMLEFHISRMFGGIEIPFEHLAGDQQETLLTRVREFIAKLPPDQQRFVMEKIGAHDLTDAAIRQAVVTGSIWGVFAAAVEVFGFSFYTAAAHILAIASLHMLPFGAYVFMSSFVSLVTGPLMILIGGIGGCWLYNRTNRKMRGQMAPLLVTCLCLAGMDSKSRNPALGSDTADDVLRLWGAARDERDAARRTTAAARTREKKVSSALAATKAQLSSEESLRSTLRRERRWNEAKLLELVPNYVGVILAGTWGTELVDSANALRHAEDEIALAAKRRSERKGFWSSLGGAISEVFDVGGLRAERKARLADLGSAIQRTWRVHADVFPQSVRSVLNLLSEGASKAIETEARIQTLEDRKPREEAELESARNALSLANKAQREAEERYFGLETV
jgi:hypothetical protein